MTKRHIDYYPLRIRDEKLFFELKACAASEMKSLAEFVEDMAREHLKNRKKKGIRL